MANHIKSTRIPITNADVIEGGPWSNTIGGTAGNDTILGHNGDDTLRGRGGDDNVIGGYGDDLVRGGSGDDHVSAQGGGDDTLVGGQGADVFVFGRAWHNRDGHNSATVTDFEDGVDHFNIYPIPDLRVAYANGDIDSFMLGSDAHYVITDGPDTYEITVENTDLSQITAADFVFGPLV